MPLINKLRTSLTPVTRTSGLSPAADALPADPGLVRLRAALTVFFALDGFLFAGWVVRIPAVKAQTGASASTLGLALLGRHTQPCPHE